MCVCVLVCVCARACAPRRARALLCMSLCVCVRARAPVRACVPVLMRVHLRAMRVHVRPCDIDVNHITELACQYRITIDVVSLTVYLRFDLHRHTIPPGRVRLLHSPWAVKSQAGTPGEGGISPRVNKLTDIAR